MRAMWMILVWITLPGIGLAQDLREPDAPESAAGEEGDSAANAPSSSDGRQTAPVVINGDATLLINGDVHISTPTGSLSVRQADATSHEQSMPSEIGRPVKILAIYPGEVKLDVGSTDGIQAGDRFAVFRTSAVETLGHEKFEGEQLVAVITVTAVSKTYCAAALWKGDRVFETDQVRPASADDSSSSVYPRRLSGLGEISMMVRPLLAVGSTGGFGTLADLTASYYIKYIFVDVRMQPLGFGWTEDGNIVSASFMAEGGYDGRAFAVGVGIGVGATNGDIDEMLFNNVGFGVAADDEGNSVEPEPWSQRTRSAFALSQQVRLGARDGLHATIYNLLMYAKDSASDGKDDSGFIYAGTAGKLVIPLAARTFLFVEGGGGVMGYGFGDLGVFTWVRGAGDAGSVGISALAGGAGIWGVRQKTQNDGTGETWTQTERVTIAGPMVGVGLTYRFGG